MQCYAASLVCTLSKKRYNYRAKCADMYFAAFEVQYVSLVDFETAAELAEGARVRTTAGAVLSLALRLGSTRLIDNIVLQPL